jgi:hypothetical protein
MPASTSFNPRTAYREDWRYVDGVEDGVLIVRKTNGEEIESHPVKLLRENHRADSMKYLWLIYPEDRPEPPNPYVGNAIVLPDTTELVITDVKPSPHTPFEIAVQETPRNE